MHYALVLQICKIWGQIFCFSCENDGLEGYRQIRGIIDYGGDTIEILVAKVKHIENRETFGSKMNTFRHSAAR